MTLANRQEYLFTVNRHTPPALRVASGEAFAVEVRGAFDDVPDIAAVPKPFTPACDGHPLAPIAGPIAVAGARPGDAVVVELIELAPFGEGKTAILRDFGVLRHDFPEPKALASPVRDGKAWFGGRIPLPLNPNLGTISTMPTDGYKPSYAGAYGGDFDQKDVTQGSRILLPVMVEDALVFFADPHACISDGIIAGTGIECSMKVKARINLVKDRKVERPIIAHDDALHFLGVGPTIEEACEDASRHAVGFVAQATRLSRDETYMLLSVVGELRVGTSPRPIMATRLIVPTSVLRDAGWNGMLY